MQRLSDWFKCVFLIAALFVASGNAPALSAHVSSQTEVCAGHKHADMGHHQSQAQHDCCGCFTCPSGLMTPKTDLARRFVAYAVRLAPASDPEVAQRFLSPELDPPRPGALS